MTEIRFPDGTKLSDLATIAYVDAITGINNTYFTIDKDNAGAGASQSLRFNRGSTAGDAKLLWDETNDRFELQSDADGPTLGDLKLDRLTLGNNSVYIERNSLTGDMEFHTASTDYFVFDSS